MKKFALLLALILGGWAMAQQDEAALKERVAQFTNTLEQQGIERYFTTTRYCIGSVQMVTLPNGNRCVAQGTYKQVYIFWQEQAGTTSVKKIDNCGLFETLTLEDGGLYQFFVDHLNVLQDEEVKPYEVANPENRPTSRTQVYPCRREFTFTDDQNTVAKKFRLYDLTNASEQQNINYAHNSALKLVALENKISAMLTAQGDRFRRMQL